MAEYVIPSLIFIKKINNLFSLLIVLQVESSVSDNKSLNTLKVVLVKSFS
jgi:hypothetical protein